MDTYGMCADGCSAQFNLHPLSCDLQMFQQASTAMQLI